MNPKAAQEILDLIMLDDMVARRAALDVWTRKWVATLQVETHYDPRWFNTLSPEGKQKANKEMIADLLSKVGVSLADQRMHAVLWGRLADNPHTLVCAMHVVLQESRDVDEGGDAAKRMMEMAKGGRS